MRKARFSETQITHALKQVESGRPVEEENRKLKEDRRGSDAGQAHPAVCDLKKAVRPASPLCYRRQ